MKDNKALKVFIVLIMIVFVVHQAYSSLYNPVTTQNAEYFTVADGISASAMFVRPENIIMGNSSGTKHFKIENGSRVAKGGTIADIYNDSSASITVSRIDELNRRISDIEEISGYNSVAATDLNLVNERLNEALNNFVMNCSSGRYSDAETYETALLSAENRKQFVTGETIDFSAKLETLKAELASLNASLPTPIGSIKADRSGYFVSGIDGYETVLSTDNLEDLTPEKIKNIKPEETDKNAIGKIVFDYDWYLVALVSANDALKYKEGDELTVKTSIRNNPSLSVRVAKINMSEQRDEATIVLVCQEMNSELANVRNSNITIVSKEYSGLKVPKKALRVVDGKTGVYVVSGLSIKFVKINVIYTTDEYILCEQVTENSSSVLRLYDEVVVKGKNLYDGKIIG